MLSDPKVAFEHNSNKKERIKVGSRWAEEYGTAAAKPSTSAKKTSTTSAVEAAWNRGSGSSTSSKNTSSGSTGGTGNSGGGGLGNLLATGGTVLAGLTGGLGQTSGGSGSWGGTNNGITIGGTMGSAGTAMQYNKEMMEAANKAAAEEAEKNRDWQKMMSDTAFQRAVEDMKKAGINPILAAGTQAPMGTGSAAATHMAAGMPEQYTYGEQSGSTWGVNSSYSYNNFAEAIQSLLQGLGDAIESGGGQTKKEGEKGMVEIIKKGVDATTSAYRTLKKGMTEAEKYIDKTGTY